MHVITVRTFPINKRQKTLLQISEKTIPRRTIIEVSESGIRTSTGQSLYTTQRDRKETNVTEADTETITEAVTKAVTETITGEITEMVTG